MHCNKNGETDTDEDVKPGQQKLAENKFLLYRDFTVGLVYGVVHGENRGQMRSLRLSDEP